MIETITAILLVAGSGFACIAGIGLVRMPDVYIRMHAATKAGTIGAGLILAAVALHIADTWVVLRVVAAVAFLFITAPVAAHMIARAAYRSGVPLWQGTVINEWREDELRRDAVSPPPPHSHGQTVRPQERSSQ
ncbi:MAG: monovalent cation/H(+) antiporter subunit G [Rhodospirillales bacterium]|nr:monovalent cation/H(+) antiporter subunit G [Rhodospirillales bacterium]